MLKSSIVMLQNHQWGQTLQNHHKMTQKPQLIVTGRIIKPTTASKPHCYVDPFPPSFNMSGNNISVFLTAKQLQDIVITCALSTGLYGTNIALSVSSLHLLIVTRGHLQYHPTKVVAFYIYILGMLGFATQAAVNVFQYFPGTVAMVNGQLKTSGLTFALVMRDGPIPQEAAISLPFIILGYVLFMVRINPIGSHIKLSETFRYGDAIHCIEVLGE